MKMDKTIVSLISLVALGVITALAFSGSAQAAPIEKNRANMKIINEIVKQVASGGRWVSDMEQFGVIEYMQDATITGVGDCEDWAVAFKNELFKRFPSNKDAFRVKYVLSGMNNEDHAVLFIYTDKRTYVIEGPSKTGTRSYLKRLSATQYANPNRVIGTLFYTSPTTNFVVPVP